MCVYLNVNVGLTGNSVPISKTGVQTNAPWYPQYGEGDWHLDVVTTESTMAAGINGVIIFEEATCASSNKHWIRVTTRDYAVVTHPLSNVVRSVGIVFSKLVPTTNHR